MLPRKDGSVTFQLFIRGAGSHVEDRAIHMFAGIVEAPAGQLHENTVGQFVPVVSGDDRQFEGMQILPEAVQADALFPGHIESGFDTNDYLGSPNWPLSEDYDIGTLLFRKTLMPPSSEGREVFTVVGLLAARSISYDPSAIQVFYGDTSSQLEQRFVGRLGVEVDKGWSVPDMEAEMDGKSMSHAFQIPVWGFNPQPYRLGPDLPDHIIRAWHDARELLSGGTDIDRFPADLKNRLHQVGGIHLFQDENYAKVLRHMRSENPEHIHTLYRPATRSQSEVAEAALNNAVEAALEVTAPAY